MVSSDGDACVIDAGKGSSAGNKIASFLKDKDSNGIAEITKVKLGFATHYDADHIGGFKKIADESGISQQTGIIPANYALQQNYPNPFNPTTNIEFSIPKSEFVTLKVYNILGEEVATLVSEKLPAGSYRYDWPARSSGGDASSLASGVYLCRIQAGDYVESNKMVLLR